MDILFRNLLDLEVIILTQFMEIIIITLAVMPEMVIEPHHHTTCMKFCDQDFSNKIDRGCFRKFQGKRRVQGGRIDVRSVLYMAAASAVRTTTKPSPIRDLFLRLQAKGKLYKVAIVACMRKLLIILNTMVKTNTPWKTPESLHATA